MRGKLASILLAYYSVHPEAHTELRILPRMILQQSEDEAAAEFVMIQSDERRRGGGKHMAAEDVEFVVGFMAISITLLFLCINNFDLPKHLLVRKIANSSVLAGACDVLVAGKKILGGNIPMTPLKDMTCQQNLTQESLHNVTSVQRRS